MRVAFVAHNGQYVVAELAGGGAVNANRVSVGPWEQFSIVRGESNVLVVTLGGYLWRAPGDGTLDAVPRCVDSTTWFTWIDHGDGTVSLRAADGRYVVAESGGGRELRADRTEIGPWEKFRVKRADAWTPIPQVPPTPPALSALRPDGRVLRSSAGHVVHVREVTAFLAFRKWLDGVDLAPFVSWARSLRVDACRVLGSVVWGPLDPRQIGDRYFEELVAFVTWIAAQGIRLEFVALADAKRFNFDQNWMDRHFAQVIEVLSGSSHLCELGNEPWHNGPDPQNFARPTGVVAAKGDLSVQAPYFYQPPWDYVTYHSPRDSEWPRKARHADDELRPAGVPALLNEPMGADEQGEAGRRSAEPEDFFYYAALAGLMAAGSCFHFQDGLRANLPGPVQQKCAEAFALGWALVDPAWRLGEYAAGHLSNRPIEHSDQLALRTYARIVGNDALALAVRPAPGWTASARDDWRITRQAGPHGSLVWLAR